MESIKEIARKCEPAITGDVNGYAHACGTAYVYYSERSDCYYASPDEHLEHDHIAAFCDRPDDYTTAEIAAAIQEGERFRRLVNTFKD